MAAKKTAQKTNKKTTQKTTTRKTTTKTKTTKKTAPKQTGLKVGSKAPTFTLPTDSGMVTLGALKGQNVVLYFYPKDDTPGCTVEACTFGNHLPKFKKMNATIIGVSRDDVKSHKKFKAKYKLPFTLASDTTEKVCKAYGVMVDKNMYGKKVRGVERSTFLIDATGTIRAIWRKVNVEGHSNEVQAALKALATTKATAKSTTKVTKKTAANTNKKTARRKAA